MLIAYIKHAVSVKILILTPAFDKQRIQMFSIHKTIDHYSLLTIIYSTSAMKVKSDCVRESGLAQWLKWLDFFKSTSSIPNNTQYLNRSYVWANVSDILDAFVWIEPKPSFILLEAVECKTFIYLDQ